MEIKDVNKIFELSIENAKRSASEGKKHVPKVGAVLTNEVGEVLLVAYRGMTEAGRHCEFELLEAAKERGIDTYGKILFVTLEPCTERSPRKIPCSRRIVDSKIKKIYIGMLDPNPLICGRGERYLRENGLIVERYPDKYIRELEEINKDFVKEFDQILPGNSLFVKKRINEILKELLQKADLNTDNLPLGRNVTIEDVISACLAMNIERSRQEVTDIVMHSLGKAFDGKYSGRVIDKDVRGYNSGWLDEFNILLNMYNIDTVTTRKTLVVGVGNGEEGLYIGKPSHSNGLYADIKDLFFVDIAEESLNKACKLFPHAKKFCVAAQNMAGIESSSIDVYLSFMVYQSSFFNIDRALSEAYRVMKTSGVIILSIAAGFMKNGNVYINGLIEPESNYVNRNMPFEIVDHIRRKMTDLHYTTINIRTTLSEIYIAARKS